MIRFKAWRWDQQELAQRLCQIVCGSDRVWRQDTGRWQIGSGNDWWLHPQENGTFLLHHRYGQKEKMLNLAAVLYWLLDVEILEVC